MQTSYFSTFVFTFFYLVFATLFGFSCLQETQKPAIVNYKNFYDLTRLPPLEFSNFQFDEKKELLSFWKKNPSRYSIYPSSEKWKNVQITFQEDKNIYLNRSRDALHLSQNSKIVWELDSGEYELSFDYGVLSDEFSENSLGNLIIQGDTVLDQIVVDKSSLQKWKSFQKKVNIKNKFSIEWNTSNRSHLFVGPLKLERIKVETVKKHNVILIIIDSLRRDALGCIPDAWNVTPQMNEICKDSLVFENHYANANWTKPSMTSLLYGEYSSNLGIINDGFKVPYYEKNIFYSHPNKGIVNLLRDQGYSTISVMNNVFFLDYTSVGIDPGFQELEQIGKDVVDTEFITKEAISSIQKHKRHPFFLHINYNTPHVPYQPPSKFLNDVKQMTKTGKNIPDSMILNYLGEVRYTDSEIGKIVAVLKDLNLYDSSYILITSDHGDLFNQNHTFEENHVTGTRWGHGQTLFNEEIAVPLIIKPPKEVMAKVFQKQIRTPTSGISMIPTLLGFMNIPNQMMRGVDYSEYFLYGSKLKKEEEIYTEGRMMESVLKDGVKYIRLFPGYTNQNLKGAIPSWKNMRQVYDLKTDPDERNNLIEEKSEEFQKVFSENRLNKNSFFLVFPQNGSNSSGKFYFPGEIYNVQTTKNIKYDVLHRNYLQFQKFGPNKEVIRISTTSPEIKYTLDLSINGSKEEYRIGAWGLPSKEELILVPELLYSKNEPELLSKSTKIWLYNDGLLKYPGSNSEKLEMGEEVRNILKSWGYIHE
jgi:arylsulfatase A-like enzyme